VKDIMTGNSAVVHGVALCRPKVISAFPITPQTTIVEELAEWVGRGHLDAKFINVEGEHSAMACAAAACTTGVRVFTASSSHGLAYMHEPLIWVAGARLPIVMVNPNRIIGAPWSIGADQTDSLMARDTGWLQIYCASAQEALDTVIQAYRLAEEISHPVMVCYDGFLISHTVEPVEVPTQEEVDAFLPPFSMEYRMDYRDPHTFHISVQGHSGLMTPLRRKAYDAMQRGIGVLAGIDREYQDRFGRGYGLVETYRNDDAEISIVTASSMAGTARRAVDVLRDEGLRIGLVRQRLFRPNPTVALQEAIGEKEQVIVLNRNLSMGVGGFFSQEIKAAFYHLDKRPALIDVIVGIGGEDVQIDTITKTVKSALEKEMDNKPIWVEAS
jgi:pyruvate/2-oxoacid:ferredoxin oxidoreductase alpha subunit